LERSCGAKVDDRNLTEHGMLFKLYEYGTVDMFLLEIFKVWFNESWLFHRINTDTK
jgi:hypothetical protein